MRCMYAGTRKHGMSKKTSIGKREDEATDGDGIVIVRHTKKIINGA